MSDSSSNSPAKPASTDSDSPLINNTLRTIDDRIDDDQRNKYKFFLETIRDSDEASLMNSVSPTTLTEIIEQILDKIDQYNLDTKSHIACDHLSSSLEDIHNNSLITLVVPNYPFVVDSVVEYIGGMSIDVDHLFYDVLPEQLFEVSSSNDHPVTFVGILIEKLDPDRLSELEESISAIIRDIESAVSDFDQLTERAETIRSNLQDLSGQSQSLYSDPRIVEDFLQFLLDDNFVFLGHFKIDSTNETRYSDRLGICDDGSELDLTALDPEKTDSEANGEDLLRFYKTNVYSRVYRRERLDSITVRLPKHTGRQAQVSHVFLGLFTNRVLTQPAVQIPILKEKFERITDQENITEHTHDYRDFYTIYNNMPKHTLLMTPSEGIVDDLNSILKVRGERTFKVRARPTPYRQGISVMILMEQERFSGDIRQRMQDLLVQEFSAESIDYKLHLGEGSLARLHFDIETEHLQPVDSNYESIEQKLFELTRTWEDNFLNHLEETSIENVKEVASRYKDIFENQYRALVEPELAVVDLQKLERLDKDEATAPVLSLRNPKQADTTRFVIYHSEKFSLNTTLPILSNHGFNVEQQSTFRLKPDDEEHFLHLFELTDHREGQLDLTEDKPLLKRSLKGVLTNAYRDDSLNQLIHKEGLTPKNLNLLRLYKNYFHQFVPAIKLESINRTFTEYSDLTSDLIEFFEIKFNPDRSIDDREREVNKLKRSITTKLEKIGKRDPYQILRSVLKLMEASLRTNYYQKDYPEATFDVKLPGNHHEYKHYISVKFDSTQLKDLENSSSRFEIFVYSPFMEAVHLRSGDIARGGIRWSDRRDDYRTEVMELMETQKKKNALIVPVGAKGGFVIKEEYFPDDRDLSELGREQYTVFMRGLLDVTDNRVEGTIESPPRVIRYDSNDPYLVVAADKGTAEFSDLANSIAEKYDFWLADAFASGGSTGYDHKDLGITAKGGWECVERHFRELGKNIRKEPFTVSGIGDMGGDVFGNGMILSDQIKLVAAFNHRRIFIDPNPDPDTSYEERKRLFEAENSSWGDYDRSLLSDGGGIYDRNASVIELADEALELLGFEKKEQEPDELIKAILRADVDLLWNGGIGTYIKSSEESHGAVEDPQNDPFRVDADEVQADVIGEGGNLGITQRGRNELAENGVRLNTDFIDNSGGVDLSDHEVNFKILLEQSIKAGEIERESRIDWLNKLKDTAVSDVLNNNYVQSGTISLEVTNSENRIDDFRTQLNYLENDTDLNRQTEQLPEEQELQDRQRMNRPMTRPEVSVILSYTKQHFYRQVLEESWPDKTIINPFLERYFPCEVKENLGTSMLKHPLKKQIAMTSFVNYAVDSAGGTFFYRLKDQLGTNLITLLKAFRTSDFLARGKSIRQQLHDLDNDVHSEVQYQGWRTLIDRLGHAVTWLVDTVHESLVYHGFQMSLKDALDENFDTILDTLQPRQQEYFRINLTRWEDKGYSTELAEGLARVSYLVPALEVIMMARDIDDMELETLSEMYFKLGRELHVDWIIRRVFERESQNRWDKLAFRTIGVEVHHIQREILQRIIQNNSTLEKFLKNNQTTLNRLHDIQSNISQEGSDQFSAYQYMVQRMRSLV